MPSDIVSSKDIAEFEENGVVLLKNVFDSRWLESVARGIHKNMEAPSIYGESLKGEGGPGVYFDDYCNWKNVWEFKEFAYESPAAEISGRLMQSKYSVFYHEHVLVKEPGTTMETPWHHDQSYYPIDGDKVCSLWMPIDPVPEDTCVQFVAGSHKWGWYLPRKFATSLPYELDNAEKLDREYKPIPDITEKNYRILKWKLMPGDCIAFHFRTLHGAPGNTSSTTSRRVLSTRWLGDDTVIADRPWTVSPPTMGGLKPGDPAVSDEFPLIWKR